MTGERFVRYLGANVGIYIAWAFLWGVPAIAGLAELSRDDGPPLYAGIWIIAVTLLYFSVLLFLQLLVYLSILYRLSYRRIAAVLLSPLAVGVLFLFASYGTAETVVVFLAGATYGASLWFPHGPRAWWQGRPRACEILDDVVRLTGPVAEWLQGGCPPGTRSGQLTGTVRSQPFQGRVVAAECDEDYFVEGEANVLIPPVPR